MTPHGCAPAERPTRIHVCLRDRLGGAGVFERRYQESFHTGELGKRGTHRRHLPDGLGDLGDQQPVTEIELLLVEQISVTSVPFATLEISAQLGQALPQIGFRGQGEQ